MMHFQSSSFEKSFSFKKICFKVKALKTFKISIVCPIKTCRFLRRRANLKIPDIFLTDAVPFMLALKLYH